MVLVSVYNVLWNNLKNTKIQHEFALFNLRGFGMGTALSDSWLYDRISGYALGYSILCSSDGIPNVLRTWNQTTRFQRDFGIWITWLRTENLNYPVLTFRTGYPIRMDPLRTSLFTIICSQVCSPLLKTFSASPLFDLFWSFNNKITLALDFALK